MSPDTHTKITVGPISDNIVTVFKYRLYAGIGAAAFWMGCSGAPVCDVGINNENCGLMVEETNKKSLVIYKNLDKAINVKITNRLDNEKINIDLVSMNTPSASNTIYILPAMNSFPSDFTYKIEINKKDLNPLDPGLYSLRFQERPDRKPAVLSNVLLRKPLDYELTVSNPYSGTVNERPIVEQIGFVGNSLVSVNSGLDTGGLAAKQVFLYNYDSTSHSLSSVDPAGYFAAPFRIETLAAFSQRDIFLLTPYMTNLPLRRCAGVKPATVADCPAVDSTISMMVEADKALVATADGTQVVRADPNGKLVQAATKAPLAWKDVPTTAIFTAATKVKLGSGDVNGDGKADLVAIWQEGSQQQVRVFLGQDSGFSEDPAWTRMLQDGLGSTMVTALAVGDVDADGCADVVVGRGLEVAIIQNQQDRFVPGWSQQLDSSMKIKEIAAVAVGRLAGNDPNQSLDIVTAANTPYDNSMPPMSTLYLHAFRPK